MIVSVELGDKEKLEVFNGGRAGEVVGTEPGGVTANQAPPRGEMIVAIGLQNAQVAREAEGEKETELTENGREERRMEVEGQRSERVDGMDREANALHEAIREEADVQPLMEEPAPVSLAPDTSGHTSPTAAAALQDAQQVVESVKPVSEEAPQVQPGESTVPAGAGETEVCASPVETTSEGVESAEFLKERVAHDDVQSPPPEPAESKTAETPQEPDQQKVVEPVEKPDVLDKPILQAAESIPSADERPVEESTMPEKPVQPEEESSSSATKVEEEPGDKPVIPEKPVEQVEESRTSADKMDEEPERPIEQAQESDDMVKESLADEPVIPDIPVVLAQEPSANTDKIEETVVPEQPVELAQESSASVDEQMEVEESKGLEAGENNPEGRKEALGTDDGPQLTDGDGENVKSPVVERREEGEEEEEMEVFVTEKQMEATENPLEGAGVSEKEDTSPQESPGRREDGKEGGEGEGKMKVKDDATPERVGGEEDRDQGEPDSTREDQPSEKTTSQDQEAPTGEDQEVEKSEAEEGDQAPLSEDLQKDIAVLSEQATLQGQEEERPSRGDDEGLAREKEKLDKERSASEDGEVSQVDDHFLVHAEEDDFSVFPTEATTETQGPRLGPVARERGLSEKANRRSSVGVGSDSGRISDRTLARRRGSDEANRGSDARSSSGGRDSGSDPQAKRATREEEEVNVKRRRGSELEVKRNCNCMHASFHSVPSLFRLKAISQLLKGGGYQLRVGVNLLHVEGGNFKS